MEKGRTALIIGSDGSEETELVATADVLRRAGIDVTIAGLQDRPTIVCSQRVSLNVDCFLSDVAEKTFDAVVLPGGQPGSNKLSSDPRVGKILQKHEKEGKIVAAICAAPLALMAHGIAQGGEITSYPSQEAKLASGGYRYSGHRVCVWKNVVTSRGPGTAFDFALKITELLVGTKQAEDVRSSLLA
jgi:protein DJ-1